MRNVAFMISCCALLAVCGGLGALHFARWSTSMGSFTAEIYEQQTPITGNNFLDLANSGFYNDLIFHRVVAGFVIQDGCPYGTGYGGPGYTIPLEIYPGFHHDQAGILAMARSADPNSAGSQYYITLAPAPHLDGNYAIFGKVLQGLDVVLDIGLVPVDANDRPITPVTIDTLRVLDLSIGTTTPPDSTLYYCAEGHPQMFIVEASSQNHIITYEWFVNDVPQPGSTDFIFETTFSDGAYTVTCRVSNAEWSHDVVWDVWVEGLAVDDPIPPAAGTLEISPNPFKEGTFVRLNSNSPELFSLGVYDLRGRLVRGAPEDLKHGGVWFWDSRNEQGKRVPAGVYIIRASSASHQVVRRCAVY